MVLGEVSFVQYCLTLCGSNKFTFEHPFECIMNKITRAILVQNYLKVFKTVGNKNSQNVTVVTTLAAGA